MTCAYYRMKLSGELWAMRVEHGRILAAVGPLPESVIQTPPMEFHSATPVNVEGWELAGFDLIGNSWTLRAKNPITPGRVVSHENAEGFSIRMAP